MRDGDSDLCLYCDSQDDCKHKVRKKRNKKAKYDCQYCDLFREFTPELYDFVDDCDDTCRHYDRRLN